MANTDRHQFNILFFTAGKALRLAPAFDQVPMLYAPLADGQAPARTSAAPRATPVGDSLYRPAGRGGGVSATTTRFLPECLAR